MEALHTIGCDWSLPNVSLDGLWGNSFNGEINPIGQGNLVMSDPMICHSELPMSDTVVLGDMVIVGNMGVAGNTGVSGNAVIMGGNAVVTGGNAVVAREVVKDGVAGEDMKALDNVAPTSKLTNDPPLEIASDVHEKRTCKLSARGEIIPLMTKDVPVNLPEWFVITQMYLEEDLDSKEWRVCLKIWANLEKMLGLSEVSLVCLIIGSFTIYLSMHFKQCMNTKCHTVILSKWLIHQKFHTLPELGDIVGYAKEWLSWWNSIQPKWR